MSRNKLLLCYFKLLFCYFKLPFVSGVVDNSGQFLLGNTCRSGKRSDVPVKIPTVCLFPSTAVHLNFEVRVTDRKSGSPATAESFALLKLTFGHLSIKPLSLRSESLIYIRSSVWTWTEISYIIVIALIFTANYRNSAEVQRTVLMQVDLYQVNPLKPELNSIYLLALLGAHYFLHVSRIGVKSLTFRRLMSYIYGGPILDVSRSHTTTQHSR